ncbi:MAG: hypothetical protein Q8R85_08840 [Bosea sp. (in: a-proteobacteria)]|uniref:hypothetical protein n=1 Tax=Bosea sp. (in: a-proteobacteria) TaxID=1871050 RepID=UPI002734FE66|nr:hypothetical protein [Bosea sp. (in: a-proteobacteria)]MDP3601255.1 hypothetical protein [Bosea sp. (in: a-proteobacteria)]
MTDDSNLQRGFIVKVNLSGDGKGSVALLIVVRPEIGVGEIPFQVRSNADAGFLAAAAALAGQCVATQVLVELKYRPLPGGGPADIIAIQSPPEPKS